jgi:hypothetical protein
MVSWYNPRNLARTGLDALISTVLAQRSDPRPLEALAAAPAGPVDYRQSGGAERREMWFDYVADVGDGWNPTFAIASCLARDTLQLGPDGTRRGEILIFGGDEVYPVASRAAYRLRLKGPYEKALPSLNENNPEAFAIPGNHDWYDSLVSFTRLFCGRDWLGGWRLPQKRSYFALRLPHHWWLLGTDIQLGSDIDEPQVEFFTTIASEMDPQDEIIFCTAEPHWLYETLYGQTDPEHYSQSNLQFLERELGNRIRIFLSGDRHYYRRHQDTSGRQKIIAGGGGAFLHPTCGEKVDVLEDESKLATSYPSAGQSAALNLLNLAFPILNPAFTGLMGLLYLAAGWGLRRVMTAPGDPLDSLRQLIDNPTSLAIPMAILAGCILFADPHSRWFRLVGGSLHGIAHLVAIPLAVAVGFQIAVSSTSHALLQLLVALLFLLVVGGLVGAWITGLYLLLSLAVFKRHHNEAFSALAVQDYKNFVRFHIRESGELVIHPVKIDRVPRWPATDVHPEPLEPPIVIPPPAGRRAVIRTPER